MTALKTLYVKTFVFSLKCSADLLAPLLCPLSPQTLFWKPRFKKQILNPWKVNKPVIFCFSEFSLPFTFPNFPPSVKVRFDHCDYSSLEHFLWRNSFILKEKGGFYSTLKYQLCNCAFLPFSPLKITLDVEEGFFLSLHLNHSSFFCLLVLLL